MESLWAYTTFVAKGERVDLALGNRILSDFRW